MQVLTILCRRLIFIAIALLATSCSQRSVEYEKIHDLPHDQWVEYAKTIPLKKRFELHHEIAENDGPNPLQSIDEAFYDQPEESYRFIVDRIRAGESHHEFLGVIFAIQRNPNFDLCKMTGKEIVQNFLKSTKGFTVREQDRPNFYRC